MIRLGNKEVSRQTLARILRTVSAVALFSSGAGAYGQVAPAEQAADAVDPSASEQEIIVTALKREERLQDVPMAITGLSAQRLENMGAENFEDISRIIPGLSVVNAGPSHNKIIIRGISSSVRVEGATTSVYFDEVPVTASGANPDLKLVDIERVEVLRGPQGTLYGESAMGGTVRYITAKPDLNEFHSRGEASYSSTRHGGSNWTANGMLNVPLLDDKLGIRIVGYYQNYSGYIDNIVLGINNINDEETYGGRVALRWVPTDNLILTLNILHQKNEFGGRNSYSRLAGDLKQTQRVREVLEDDFTIINLTAQFDLGWATLDSSTSYSERSLTETRDCSEPCAPYPTFIGRDDLLGSPISLLDFGGGTGIVQEIRLASTGDGPFQYIIGGYLSVDHGGLPQAVVIHPAAEPDVLAFGTLFVDNDLLQIAAFGELSYNLTRQLKFTLGARWYQIRNNIGAATTGPLGTGMAGAVYGRSSENGILPKALISYDTGNILLYAQAAKGFRPGGAVVGVPVIPGIEFPDEYQSDSVWSYEVGAKTSWFDDRVTANLALFHIDWTNIQNTVVIGNTFVPANSGSAVSQGIELEISARPVQGLELGFTGTLTDAKLNEDQVFPNFGLKGDRLPGIPKESFSLYGRYTMPVGNSGWSLYLQGDYQYVGDSKNSFTNTLLVPPRIPDPQPAYDLANLRLGIENDRFELAVFANNIWDERATLYVNRVLSHVEHTNRPRTIGIMGKVNF